MARRVMIAGAMGGPALGYGGNTWAFLQYVLGFRRLGLETYYLEELDPKDSVDDAWQRVPFAASTNARYFAALVERHGLAEHAALLARDGDGHVGLSRPAVERLARDVDLLVNLSGRLHLASVLGAVRRRLYLDMDPGYTQIWQARYGVDMNLPGHDVHVTVGLNLGQPDCPLPTCGVRWQTTLPPVVLDEWTATSPPGGAYTTVADWRGFSPIEWRGVWYGPKSREFLRLVDLPRRVAVPLELCLLIEPDDPDRATLETHGWRLVPPRVHAARPETYRAYLLASRGEFTCVKEAYAAGRTGWFSDRSACYLAAGRPVVVQDTGIGKFLPTGAGLLTFRDLDGAAAAIGRVEAAYPAHAAAAAAFARAHLDSDRVLPRLLEVAGL